MNTKILIAALVGGVVSFLAGWLIYGTLLMDYYAQNTNQCMNIADMKDMNMFAMVLSCLFSGYMFALVLSWASVSTFMNGATKGLLIGILLGASLDLSFYSMTTMYNNTTIILVDIVVAAAMGAITGGIVGWALGWGKAKEA